MALRRPVEEKNAPDPASWCFSAVPDGSKGRRAVSTASAREQRGEEWLWSRGQQRWEHRVPASARRVFFGPLRKPKAIGFEGFLNPKLCTETSLCHYKARLVMLINNSESNC